METIAMPRNEVFTQSINLKDITVVRDLQQSLARIGIDYHLSSQVMLTVRCTWIVSFPYGGQPIDTKNNQHRKWQQLTLQQKLGQFYVHHRYQREQERLENVFLEHVR